MKERIRLLRKALNLNQSDFGKKVGVKGNTIGNYELGLRNPSEAVVFSICREFNVNEEWLRNGTGEMFEISKNDEYTKATESIAKSNDFEIMSLLIEYWKLDDANKEILKNYLKNVNEKMKEFYTQQVVEPNISSEQDLQKLVVDVDDINADNLHPDIRKHVIKEKYKRDSIPKTNKEIG